MPNVKVVINGDTITDADPGEWNYTPPDQLDVTKLRANNTQQPYMLALMQAYGQACVTALTRKQGTTLTVTTIADGWTLDVDYAPCPSP